MITRAGDPGRPLFEEPTEALEREAPWDGVAGFMVGGIANADLAALGQQYFDAANALADMIQARQCEDYRLANPTLYLYRHAIELLTKAALVKCGKTHDLANLADRFHAEIKATSGYEVPAWVVQRLKEIAAIDPGNGTAFRYNQVYDRKSKQDEPVDGEFHVDLAHLQSSMQALNAALVEIVDAVALGEGPLAGGRQ